MRTQAVRLSDKVSITIRPNSKTALFWITTEGYSAPLQTLRNAHNVRYAQVITDGQAIQIDEAGEITTTKVDPSVKTKEVVPSNRLRL